MSLLDEYRLTSRGTKGVITMNMTDKTGKLVATRAVNGDEDIIVITKLGVVIRTSLKQVSISGRNTQGVKIIKLKDEEVVSSVTSLPAEEENTETPVENTENVESQIETSTEEINNEVIEENKE